MNIVPLAQAVDASRYGGKAASLATALRAGLPVPPGWALDVDATEHIAQSVAVIPELVELAHDVPPPWAVRSSAIGEDGTQASFAGQHLTRLGVRDLPALATAVGEVYGSARSPAALAYRARLHIAGTPQIAVVIQALVPARVAGVMFTRSPLAGADERVIEASWGLGEAVVSGLVTPDHVRMDSTGRLLEYTIGEKQLRLDLVDQRVVERETTPVERAAACVDDDELAALHELAESLDRVWSGPHDVEFAFVDGVLWLVQRRPMTTGR